MRTAVQKMVSGFHGTSFLIILSVIELTKAHVTLTFPEARFPPLDFLDTFRTAAPCGVPKSSRSAVTNLRVGQSYNVTWRMQYPHQGGFRLQLFSSTGTLVQQLAPPFDTNNDTFIGLDDQTAESYIVHFLRECHECTLRLERQALEWGDAYRFRSCAEVNVFANLENECSGHGESPDGQSCQCHKRNSGDHCQYKDDCAEDVDCSNGGKCVADGIAPNQKSCFCAYGFFGNDCSQKSLLKADEDISDEGTDGEPCFAYSQGGDTSGLKYGMFNVNCFKAFALNNADGDFIYTRVIKGEVEIVLDFVTDSWLGLGWRPLQIPNSCRLFPDLATHAAVSVIDASNGRNDSANIAISGFMPTAFNAALHPMDCMDVVMASIVTDSNGDASFLHIRDMYTRDRSTPLSDAFYEGEQSLTAAYGRQVRTANNTTRSVVMFRRMIREIEPTDHPLGPGETFVIFAKGQKAGAYSHLAKSAIEHNGGDHVRTKNFYRADQWKYHGDKNRGVRKLELVSETEMAHARSPLRHLNLNQQSRREQLPNITTTTTPLATISTEIITNTIIDNIFSETTLSESGRILSSTEAMTLPTEETSVAQSSTEANKKSNPNRDYEAIAFTKELEGASQSSTTQEIPMESIKDKTSPRNNNFTNDISGVVSSRWSHVAFTLAIAFLVAHLN